MAKKNETKSPKSSSKSSSKSSPKNIGSSSLLPARPHGEKPDMVFSVKSEPREEQMEVDINSQEISNLFQVISDAKNKSGIFENDECSNQSTCTEPMDTTTTEAQPQSPSVPTCFSNVQIKEEKGSPEKSADHAEYFTEGRTDEANIRAISPLKCEEPNIITTDSFVKSEPKGRSENNEEQLENKNEKILSKRKTTFDLELEVIKKKFKKETAEDTANINVTNCNPIDQANRAELRDTSVAVPSKIDETNCESEKDVSCDKQSVQDAIKEEIIDHEISVLVLPEKNIETIVLSDDENDQNSDDDDTMKSESAKTSPKKCVKARNFSTEILNYFNVVSEIDRYDCYICLEFLQQKNINSNLQIYFPSVKKERNVVKVVKNCDILFKNITLIQSDITRIPVIQNDNSVLHSPVEKSKMKSYPGLIPISSINRTSISQNVHDIPNSLSQSTVTVPQTACNLFSHHLLLATNSSNPNVNMPYSWSEHSNSLTNRNISSISTSQLEDILKRVQTDTASDQHYTRNISQIADSGTVQNISSVTLDLLNSLPRDMFLDTSTNEATSDYHLTKNSNQDSITNTYPPSQAMSLMHNHTFQSTSCAQNTTPFATAISSSPAPSTSYASGVPYVLPSSDIENSVQDRNIDILQHLAYKMISTSDHLHTVSSSQIIDSTAMFNFPSQSIAPLPEHASGTPSQVLDKTSFATTVSSFPVSSAYVSGIPCTLPNSNIESSFQNKNTAVIEHPSYKKQLTSDCHYAKNSSQVTNCTRMSQISPDHALQATSSVQDPRVARVHSSYSEDNNNPHNVIKKNKYPSNSQAEGNFQNRNTAVVQLSGALKHKSRENRDPRTNARQAVEFPPRMGDKDKQLYLNIGLDNIDKHFLTLVLQWNPIWLEIQEQTNAEPPIAVHYKCAAYFYMNELDYYNTYVPMHMLQLWYHIFYSWKVNRFTNVCKYSVIQLVDFDNGCKIMCFAVISTEKLPKIGDIALCEFQKEKAFIHFEDVKMKVSENKVKVTLRSLHNFTHLKENDVISLCILYNINIAQLQTASLNSIEPSLKPLVLKPSRHLDKIEIVKLNPGKKIKEQREDILIHIKSSETVIVVVEINFNNENTLLLTQLTFNILLHFNTDFNEKYRSGEKQTSKEKQKKSKEKDFKILILLKNDSLLESLFKRLFEYKPILAVRSQQIKLSPQLIKYTLENHLEKIPNPDRLQKKDLMNQLIKNHHIFLSTFSSFGAVEKSLFRIKDLIVIMDGVHWCTEPETAWPLTMKIAKLILIGNSEEEIPRLPSKLLMDNKFDTTLFLRMLKGRNCC